MDKWWVSLYAIEQSDPFVDAVPCYNWPAKAWELVEWLEKHYGLAFRVLT